MFLGKVTFEGDTVLKVNYYECSETGDDLYTSSLSPGVLRPSIPRRHHLPGDFLQEVIVRLAPRNQKVARKSSITLWGPPKHQL